MPESHPLPDYISVQIQRPACPRCRVAFGVDFADFDKAATQIPAIFARLAEAA